ncbi:TPA: hypothetical protein ACS7XC_001523 [Providencia alcalifaciens]
MLQTDSANIIALQQIVAAIIFILPDEERIKVKAIIECFSQLDLPNKIALQNMTKEQLTEFIGEMNSTYTEVLEMVSTFELAKEE